MSLASRSASRGLQPILISAALEMPGLWCGVQGNPITFKVLTLERLNKLGPFTSRLPVKNFKGYWNFEIEKVLFSWVLLKRAGL